MSPTIITRPGWDARPPSSAVDTVGWDKRSGFVVHYSSVSKDQTVRSIQNFHMDTNGWRDIGYNWLVTVDGRVWEGRQHTWSAIGAHVENHNTENIGVCMIGTNADVTDAAKRSIRWLYDQACVLAGKTLAKRYHSQYAPTSCPGDNLRNWVIAGMPVTTTGGSMELNTVLGIAAPKTVDASLSNTLQIRDWLMNPPGSTGSGYPGNGSRGALLVDAAEAVLAGELVDAQAVADALAANEAFRQAIIDGVVAGITQQPMNVALSVSLSGAASGQATPVP